ncbi:hypothetical protein E6C76_17810 [Pseudothauera nasutitermitis]|uniref:Transmembrane protein n=1 Tax=Pseudothauera nasutitermitis TaxID=2565930 RepID=A0A4S4AT79_9RHOO|nr:BPSS1780 family membrane protein [Pseudothauera nasutitermitis]THF63105.1 hypothetical protein E6C76_17810 [Pseudothauera nasutitermitis]
MKTLPQPRHVAPAHTLRWLTEGWRGFVANPGIWLIQAVVFIVILAALGFVPLIGWAAAPIALPVLAGGLVTGALAQARGEALRVDHLFEGVRRHTGNLLLVGVFHLVGAFGAALIGAAIGGSAVLTGMLLGAFAGAGVAAGGVMLGVLIFTVLWALLIMALWFAAPLVLHDEVAPLDAMKLSAQACLASPLTFLVLAALLYVLVWIAMLPAGLGMLVLVPVLAGTLRAAWQDVFGNAPALPAPTPETPPNDAS